MKLEDKLVKIINKAIVRSDRSVDPLRVDEDAVKQVVQAFKDAGWVEGIRNDPFMKGWNAGYHTAELEFKAVGYVGKDFKPEYMKGEHWYNAFISEMEALIEQTNTKSDFTEAILAARKAAGME